MDYSNDLINGKLKFKLVDPVTVYMDPDGKEYDLSDHKYIIKVVRGLSEEDLLDLFPEKSAQIKKIETAAHNIDSIEGIIQHIQGTDYPPLSAGEEYTEKDGDKSFDLVDFLKGPRVLPVGIGFIILVLLFANPFKGNDASDDGSNVIYAAVTTTTAAPSPGAAFVEQAVQLIVNKQYDTALTVLDQAIAADPTYGLSYYNQGVAYQFSDKLEEAVASYTKALSFNKQDASSHYNRGLAQRDLGKLTEAEADLKAASLMKPDWAAAKFNLGQVLTSLGKGTDGAKYIAEARAIDPNIGK
jgi:tetratricopeptide (TPR) repeat protein